VSNIEQYIGLLIQVPLVGIFVWFSLAMIKLFTDLIDRRDKAWQEFLKQQQETNNNAIKAMAERFADEIRSLGKEIASLHGEMK